MALSLGKYYDLYSHQIGIFNSTIFSPPCFSVIFPAELGFNVFEQFSASLRAQLLEMFLQLCAGGSLVLASSRMAFSEWFNIFGWLIVVTSLLLLLIPWKWHNAFAKIVVPPLTNRVWVFGVFSLLLGMVIIFALAVGNA